MLKKYDKNDTAIVPQSTVSSTRLMAGLSDDELSAAQAETRSAGNRWAEIRLLSNEEAAEQLSGDELEAFNNYHQRSSDDMDSATELATLIMKGVEIPQVKPKTKGQRKRDKFAKSQALAAAKAKMRD